MHQRAGLVVLLFGLLEKKDYLCTILQDEGFASIEMLKEISRWEIPDGTPNSVEALPNDKILMAFGDQIISFSFDGFEKELLSTVKFWRWI